MTQPLEMPQCSVGDLGAEEAESRKVHEPFQIRQAGVCDLGVAEVEFRKIGQPVQMRIPSSVTCVLLMSSVERFVRFLRCASPASVT